MKIWHILEQNLLFLIPCRFDVISKLNHFDEKTEQSHL